VKWTEPHPVLHPSPIDPPSTHFYGMPQFFIPSAGLFVGFLWLQHMPYNDVMGGQLRPNTPTPTTATFGTARIR
jgi:hypothetical protein